MKIIRTLFLIIFISFLCGCLEGEGDSEHERSAHAPEKAKDACVGMAPVKAGDILHHIPESVPNPPSDRLYPIYLDLGIDRESRERLLGVSTKQGSYFDGWKHGYATVEAARIQKEALTEGEWRRVYMDQNPYYAYLGKALSQDENLTCLARQDPDNEILFDGTCNLAGKYGDLYYEVSFLREPMKKIDYSRVSEQLDQILRCLVTTSK